MLKLITGKKGTGKTKILMDMINKAVKNTSGNVVCIEKGAKLTYDIDHSVRLVDSEHYGVDSYDKFYGFVAGMLAGNYDIKEVFVDSILKIGGQDLDALADMLVKLDNLSGSEVELVFTVSADSADLPDYIKKYIV